MAAATLLLIQARAPADPLTAHERACVERRLAGLDCMALRVKNALGEPADPGWLDGVDGVVVGGSGAFSVNHPRSQVWVDPLRHLYDRVLSQRVPFFGICFGHQLLGLHLGAEVATHPELEEVGTVDYQLTAAGLVDELFSPLGGRFYAHTGHSDHVVALPDELQLIARNDHVETQAFRLVGAPIYSTQFHPDLEGAEAIERYLAVKGDGPEAQRKAEAFAEADRDEAATLLRRFVELHLCR
jgi:GMP synthase (glutamine-hydrolysing)